MHDETSILPETETPLVSRLLMLLVPLLLVIGIIALLWGTGGGLRLAADS
jgi:hypothetical protein